MHGDPLASQRMIVAIDLDGDAKEANCAWALRFQRQRFANCMTKIALKTVKFCEWSKREAKVMAHQNKRVWDRLVLAQKNWKDCDPDAMAQAMLDGILDLGLAVCRGVKPAKLLLGRINNWWQMVRICQIAADGALIERIDDWLLPHLGGMRSKADLGKLDMVEITNSLLTWDENNLLNQLSPPYIIAPTGTKMMVDYSGEQPQALLCDCRNYLA